VETLAEGKGNSGKNARARTPRPDAFGPARNNRWRCHRDPRPVDWTNPDACWQNRTVAGTAAHPVRAGQRDPEPGSLL